MHKGAADAQTWERGPLPVGTVTCRGTCILIHENPPIDAERADQNTGLKGLPRQAEPPAGLASPLPALLSTAPPPPRPSEVSPPPHHFLGTAPPSFPSHLQWPCSHPGVNQRGRRGLQLPGPAPPAPSCPGFSGKALTGAPLHSEAPPSCHVKPELPAWRADIGAVTAAPSPPRTWPGSRS